MSGRSRRRTPEPAAPEPVSLQLIASKLERLTWRRRLWGVDERQVWHVIHRMDEMYRELYRKQQIRYEALLEQAGSRAGSGPIPQTLAASAAPDPGETGVLSQRTPASVPTAPRVVQAAGAHRAQPATPGSAPLGTSWR